MPKSHPAQPTVQFGSGVLPGRVNVRYNMNKPAVHPPSSAVSVKYIFNRAEDDSARSAPPGIAVNLLEHEGNFSRTSQMSRAADLRVHCNTTYRVKHIRCLIGFDTN